MKVGNILEATASTSPRLIQQMDDIDAMFSEMLGEMDLLTQVSVIVTHVVLHGQTFYLLSDVRMLVGGLVCLPSSTHFFSPPAESRAGNITSSSPCIGARHQRRSEALLQLH